MPSLFNLFQINRIKLPWITFFDLSFMVYFKSKKGVKYIMSYITLGISIAGFILSSAQWIYTLYCKRTNYRISIEKFEWYEHQNYNSCILTLSIQNLSNSPLIITRMYVGDVQCHLTHAWVGDHYYPRFTETDIPCTERILSADFPLNIVANSGTMYKVIFDFQDKSFVIEKLLKIKVQSTNKLKTFTLYCPNKCNGLNI